MVYFRTPGSVRDGVNGPTDLSRFLESDVPCPHRLEHLLLALFQLLPQPAALNDHATGRYLAVNDSFVSTFGFSRQEVIGKTALDLNLWADLEDRRKTLKLLAEHGVLNSMKMTFRRKDGSSLHALCSAKIIRDDGKKYVLSLIVDISEYWLGREALRESETKYRLIAENIVDVVWTTDEQLRFTYISPSVERLRGLTPEEAMRQSSEQTMPPASFQTSLKALEAWRLAEAKGEKNFTARFEIEQYRADGSTVWVECVVKPHADAQGRRLGFIGLSRDVTERKRTETALRESETRFKAFFDNSAVSMAMTNAEGRWLQANKTFQALIGYDEEELGSMTYPEVIHPAYREAAVAEITSLVDGDIDRFWMELRLLPKDGKLVWADVFVSPLRDESGAVTSLAGIALDTTQRKLAERALRESEARFHSFLDNIPAPIWIADEHDRLVFVNKRHNELHDFNAAQPAGRPTSNLFSNNLLTPYWVQARKALDEDRAVDEEVALPAAGGELRRWRRIVFPLRTSEGRRFVGGVGIDVTSLRRLQREAEEARDAAEQANRAKSEFLANMSHEIRTPLNGILGMAELALQGDPSPETARYLRLIKQSGWSLQEIIGDILDFAKIESSGVMLERKPFSLRTMLDEALGPIGYLAADKGALFAVETALEVPDLILGDETRLKQVLVNLAGNAVKFTDKGGVRVRVERVGFSGWPTPSARLLFSVHDSGIGIEPGRLSGIFDSFSQAHADHGKYSGTGLGLTISKRIVEAMNGRIWAESEPGRGSVFSVVAWFELAAPEAASQPDVPEASPSAKRFGLKALIVEDNAINRLLAEELLKKRGCRARSVGSAAEALEALAAEPFDLALMDIRMPGMSGDEATRLIRKGLAPGVPPDIPIVALTAHALAGDRERFLAAGMDDYLTKPLDPASLDRLLERIARLKTPRGRGQEG